MGLNDKGIEGSSSFPVTSWSVIRNARDPGSPEYERHLARLVQLYWRPVYSVIRHTWNVSLEEARDLTQDFFAVRVFDKGLLAAYAPERGSFRALLRAAVMNFLRQSARDAARLRRGGHVAIVSFDEDALALAERLPASGQTPEEIFDAAWNEVVIEKALALLDQKLTAEGQDLALRAFRLYDLGETDETMSYGELATELGATVAQVKYVLSVARAAFRGIVAELAREYADDPEALASELRLLTRG